MTAQHSHVDRRFGQQPPATLTTRVAARLVDAAVLAAVGGALGLAVGFGPSWLVLQAVTVFGYFVLLDVIWGTTPGKRLLGLRVQGADGGRPTLGQAAIREAFTLAGAVPYAGPILALAAWIVIAVTIHSSPVGQGTHDRLAGGTRVVRG